MQFFLILFFVLLFSPISSQALSIDEYIEQIKGENGEYNAATKRNQSYELLRKKAELVTAPSLFASAETGYNEQITALPFFRYNKVLTQNYSAGISQNTSFGLTTKFTYALNKVDYSGLPTANQLATNNYQTRPVIEVSFPLLQNRFGSSTRANRDLIENQNQALKYAAQSVLKSTFVLAEQNYWSLAAAKKIVAIQQLAALQAQKILEYVKRKEGMNLGETADVLQAQALVETKKLELRQAQNDFKQGARNFNKLRHVDSDEVVESLDIPDVEQIKKIELPKIKESSRPDIKAAQANMKAAIASAKIEEENSKPSLNLYGAYAFKGVQANLADAVSESTTARSKEGLIGLKFSVPFYFGTIIDIQQGARMNADAARNEYRQKAFNEQNEWESLLLNLAFYQERTMLAQAIENAQKLKLENERKLLKQGRTSTYQVLLFEQEYCQAQISAINNAAQFFILMAQKRLYEN